LPRKGWIVVGKDLDVAIPERANDGVALGKVVGVNTQAHVEQLDTGGGVVRVVVDVAVIVQDLAVGVRRIA